MARADSPKRALHGFVLVYGAGLSCMLSVPLLAFMASVSSPPIPLVATLAVPLAGVCLGWAGGSAMLGALRSRSVRDEPGE